MYCRYCIWQATGFDWERKRELENARMRCVIKENEGQSSEIRDESPRMQEILYRCWHGLFGRREACIVLYHLLYSRKTHFPNRIMGSIPALATHTKMCLCVMTYSMFASLSAEQSVGLPLKVLHYLPVQTRPLQCIVVQRWVLSPIDLMMQRRGPWRYDGPLQI